MDDVKILHITNMYPKSDKLYFGIFVKKQINSLVAKGLNIRTICVGEDFGGYRKIFSLRNNIEWTDLIHCHFGHTGSLALFWKYLLDKPLVVSYCGDDLLGSVVKGRYSIKGKILSSLNRLLSRFVDFAIVKSEFLAKKVETKRKEVIPNGVDMGLFREIDRAIALNKIRLFPKGKKNILFLGQRNISVKNYKLFKNALQCLDFDYEEIVLENIPYEEVPFYMNAADVCVLTSFHEGSPNAVKEAMACNRPIVSVDTGDVKNLLEGVGGCFVTSYRPKEIAQSIKRALEFNKSQGRKRILELGLDLNSTAERIIKIYRSILETR